MTIEELEATERRLWDITQNAKKPYEAAREQWSHASRELEREKMRQEILKEQNP